MITGLILFSTGLVGFILLFSSMTSGSWTYNGIEGLLQLMLKTGMVLPLSVLGVISVIGISICLYQAFFKNEE